MPSSESVSAEVIARQNALFDLHREWMHGQADSPFDPDQWPAPNSVYNQHSPDLDANAADLDDFHSRAQALFQSTAADQRGEAVTLQRAVAEVLDELGFRYSPEQPRVPEGSPAGGQFGAAEAAKPAESKPRTLAYNPKTGKGPGYGMKGGDPDVRRLQAALNRLGLTDAKGRALKVDGKLGPLTTEAVKDAQRKLGLEPTGRVTPTLLKKLSEAKKLEDAAEKPAAKSTSKGQKKARALVTAELLALGFGDDDDDDPIGDLDDATQALLQAMAELDAANGRAFNPKQPRFPKGHPLGGKFMPIAEVLKGRLKDHLAGNGKGDPFDGFSREQLRKAARARGIVLKRGEDRDSIARKLLANLDVKVKAVGVAKVPVKKAADSPRKSNKFHRDISGAGLDRLADTVEGRAVRTQRTLAGGQMGDTRLVTYSNGDMVVRKESKAQFGNNTARMQADAEQLAPLVIRALGINAPRVYRSDKDGETVIHMEYISDKDKPGSFGDPIQGTNEGRVMALIDTLILNGDRHGGNYFIKDGHIVPIDNGLAFDDGFFHGLRRGWEPPHGYFTRSDMAEVRRRLEALRPEFERVGRADWHDGMMRRVTRYEKLTGGGPDRLPPPV